MASGAGPALAHRSVASIRGGPSQGQLGSPTPHTPPRTISSTYGSPSTIRADDDILVIEFGSRFIRAGFAGDSLPKATLQCGPEDQRRAGDFRAWQNPGHRAGRHAWAEEREIWRHDTRNLDLGLVQDKLERVLREAFTKYLLTDSRPRRMGLVLDSGLPLPLLSALLDILFNRFQAPLVSLMSSPVMCAVGAGVRSALVVDLGWQETVITSVYEYREVRTSRSTRAGRHLLDQLYKLLRDIAGVSEGDNSTPTISFDECEDILYRLMWCRSSAFKSSQRQSAQLETVEEQDESEANTSHSSQPTGSATVTLTSFSPPSTVEIPFEKLADVCDQTFLDQAVSPVTFDDHELPVHLLLYRHLLQLPLDVRAICMPRIMFIGGCSTILGLKERLVDEVMSIIDRRGWAPVAGKAVEQLKDNENLRRRSNISSPGEATPTSSEGCEEPEKSSTYDGISGPKYDAIEAKLARTRPVPKLTQGELRALHTLGPWAGASLLYQLKIPAVATIDRELWLQQGVNGASRPGDVDIKAQQRQSLGAGGIIRGSGGHHTNWTLGTWGGL